MRLWGVDHRNGSPEVSPIPSPSVVHNPGRLFKEFSTRVLVIYLDSDHPAGPEGDRPPPNPLPPQPHPWSRSSSPARQAWPCSRLLQMALPDIAGFQGTPESHFWSPSQHPNILWTLLDPSLPAQEVTGDFLKNHLFKF